MAMTRARSQHTFDMLLMNLVRWVGTFNFFKGLKRRLTLAGIAGRAGAGQHSLSTRLRPEFDILSPDILRCEIFSKAV